MAIEMHKQNFYKTLQKVFIGEKVKGQGSFINLMRIKSKYYQKIEKYNNTTFKSGLTVIGVNRIENIFT